MLLAALTFCSRPSGLLGNVRVGKLLGDHPMKVVSGQIDQPTVHFEAPPRRKLEAELDALIRTGIAHLWLITLHPFDDGNGRVTRVVTDKALAQAERQSVCFYPLNVAIMARLQKLKPHPGRIIAVT